MTRDVIVHDALVSDAIMALACPTAELASPVWAGEA